MVLTRKAARHRSKDFPLNSPALTGVRTLWTICRVHDGHSYKVGPKRVYLFSFSASPFETRSSDTIGGWDFVCVSVFLCIYMTPWHTRSVPSITMQVASCTLTVEADPNVLVCSCVLKGTVSEEELRALSVGTEFKKKKKKKSIKKKSVFNRFMIYLQKSTFQKVVKTAVGASSFNRCHLTPWARPACVSQVYSTSWASLFLLFIDKERTNMAASREAQTWSLETCFCCMSIYIQTNQVKRANGTISRFLSF